VTNLGQSRACPAARFDDALKTSPPRLDEAGAKKYLGYVRVLGLRRMHFEQGFRSPSIWQLAGIPNHQVVGIHADLIHLADVVVLDLVDLQIEVASNRSGPCIALTLYFRHLAFNLVPPPKLTLAKAVSKSDRSGR